MSLSGAGTIDRRDALVASALAGMVVVILGYASGLGIQTPGALAASPQPAAPSVPVVQPATPAEIPTPAAAVSVPSTVMDMGATPPGIPVLDVPVTPTPPVLTPTPDPDPAEPADPATDCPTSLLAELPVVGPLTTNVTSLLTSLAGSTPVLDQLTGSSADGKSAGLLTGVLESLLGSGKCRSVPVVATESQAR